MISFGRQICSDFHSAIQREWLETNGLGGYAFSNVCMASTRRSHGLLVVPSDTLQGTFVLLNRLEEKISGSGWSRQISCQEYPGIVSPEGYTYLEQFAVNPFPSCTYLVEDARIRRTIFLVSGEHTAVILYELISGMPVQIEIRPLCGMRGIDSLVRHDQQREPNAAHTEDSVTLASEGLPCVTMKTSSGFFQKSSCWYDRLVYRRDASDGTDDLYSPGIFRFSLMPGKTVALAASTETLRTVAPDKLFHRELFIRRKISENLPVKGDFARALFQSADQFVISKPHVTAIMRGYPGCGESIKETLIALPGLCLVTGRFPEAKEILMHTIDRILDAFSRGDTKTGDYSVETVLWYYWAVQKYLDHSGDITFIRSIFPHLMALYMDVRRGLPGIYAMDDDGLIISGNEEEGGKFCGIQALWYNALQFMEELEMKLGGKRKRYKDLALRVRESFNTRFWSIESSYVRYSIKKDGYDASIRPDALLSISLPYPVLDQKRFINVFTTAWKKLYTSFGLRSRDKDTVQGTAAGSTVHPVWMGSFLTAYFKVFGHNAQKKLRAWQFLIPFEEHLSEELIGSLSEFFDGHRPRGYLAYAPSVAELLRVLVEDMGSQPENNTTSISDMISSTEKGSWI